MSRRDVGIALVLLLCGACSSAQPRMDAGASVSDVAGQHAAQMPSSDAADAAPASSQTMAGASGEMQMPAVEMGGMPATVGGHAEPAAGSGGPQPGAGGAGGSVAAGAGGTVAAGSGGTAGQTTATMRAPFALMGVGFEKANADEFAFPPDAINTVSISPEFKWTGVPPEAKSLALVFRDLSMRIVKWVVWNIPPTVTDIPKGISQASQNLTEIPGAMQLGALGHQGYYGACCTENHYEWVLWALDVEKLPGTEGQTTAYIRDTILPAHEVATTPPVLMRRVTP